VSDDHAKEIWPDGWESPELPLDAHALRLGRAAPFDDAGVVDECPALHAFLLAEVSEDLQPASVAVTGRSRDGR
jgi:hypothetical protein